jgi:histidine triad (HIT) family protein
MTNTELDLTNIKVKIIEQIKSQYDEPQAKEFISKIKDMTDEQFVEFLKQQGLIQGNGEAPKQQCILCSMVFGDIPTTKIGENEKAISILELNPVTKGHTLIIPKEHIETQEKLPPEVKDLANKVSEKIKKAFNPKRIDAIPGHIMGHQLINILPIYNNETIDSPREKQTPESLAKLKEKIENIQQEQIEEKETLKKEKIAESKEEEINEKNTWLPKRIP